MLIAKAPYELWPNVIMNHQCNYLKVKLQRFIRNVLGYDFQLLEGNLLNKLIGNFLNDSNGILLNGSCELVAILQHTTTQYFSNSQAVDDRNFEFF